MGVWDPVQSLVQAYTVRPYTKDIHGRRGIRRDAASLSRTLFLPGHTIRQKSHIVHPHVQYGAD
jgi:hypothetical protein